jgi:hypothetical protein
MYQRTIDSKEEKCIKRFKKYKAMTQPNGINVSKALENIAA